MLPSSLVTTILPAFTATLITFSPFFYFQLKLYAKNNEHAIPFLKEADDKRKNFSRKLFNDAGQSAKEVEKNRRMMRVYFMGRMALMMGYDADPSYPEYSKDELLEMFGLNK